MSVTIDHLTFDHASDDADGDVLYLHVGEPQAAAYSEETPEGTRSGSRRTVGSSA